MNDIAIGTMILLDKIFEVSPKLKRPVDIKIIKDLIATKDYRFMSENVEELKELTPNNEYINYKVGGYKKQTRKNSTKQKRVKNHTYIKRK